MARPLRIEYEGRVYDVNASEFLRRRSHCREGRRVAASLPPQRWAVSLRSADAAIPQVESDSRLGWVPSMECVADRGHLEWMTAQVQRVQDEEIPAYRRGPPVPSDRPYRLPPWV